MHDVNVNVCSFNQFGLVIFSCVTGYKELYLKVVVQKFFYDASQAIFNAVIKF